MNEKETSSFRAYEVILSSKDRIKIDADELPVVVAAIQAGSVCAVRQGIFNPSHYVCIVEDESRLDSFFHEKKRRDSDPASRPMTLRLKNIFDGVSLGVTSKKRLNG